MGIVSEFKKFALRGNVIDLAVGFTVGAAFTAIAKSLVNDIIMPPLGLLIGSADLKDIFWVVQEGPKSAGPYVTLAEAQAAGAVTVNFGNFLNSLVAFLLVALALFFIIRFINKMESELEERFGDPVEEKDPVNKKCPYCRSMIPYKATKCAHCTSDLEPEPDPDANASAPHPA